MDLQSFKLLLTPQGQQALEAAAANEPREVDFLKHFDALRRRYPEDLARAALETAILRGEAQAKFPFAAQMYFTRPALEQASSFSVSAYRSARFRPFKCLVDLGCSIGGDTLSLAPLAPTLAIDLDPLRLAMARANLAALDLQANARFVQADLNAPLPLEPRQKDSQTALFFDPARRADGRRVFSVQDYHPPLSVTHTWLERFPALGVKISPGVNLQELAGYEAEIEFISLEGELKETVLWFGPLKTAARRATLLPGPHSLQSSLSFEQAQMQRGQILPVNEPRACIYEPDPAVIRAGLVEDLGLQLQAAQLDPDIAYLTADHQVETPFARSWTVEAWFPFQLKRLRAALRERGVGRVVVKKRGSPLQPEALIQELKLKGDHERVIFLTRLRGRPIIILCYPQSVTA